MMEDHLKILALISAIHSENMLLIKALFPGEDGDKMVKKYEKQFEKVLDMNIREELEKI